MLKSRPSFLYEDANAYDREGPWRKVTRPGHRNYLGHVDTTIRDMNTLELVLGTNGRSGGQWDIWQAVYSPVGANGYPKPIWDKRTGVIDPDVATHWRDNYDLGYILRRDWTTLGPSSNPGNCTSTGIMRAALARPRICPTRS